MNEIYSELIKLLKEERERLVGLLPYEFVVSNIVLCVIKVIHEENGRADSGLDDLVPYDSLNDMNARVLRKSAIAAINELAIEIDTCIENICNQVRRALVFKIFAK
ncbi:unnamed protein product [Gongylonema pulchrum]|uniref:Phage protein n=1 Tax=Gongylonema pulchrum TaxID=637853 RepID=A0A183EE03_9BILA|nr:unnamed protein product [Gongylonema pulchrum]